MCMSMRPQEDQIVRSAAENRLRGRPQQRGLLVRAFLGALRPTLRTHDTQMPHHRVVPGHELFCQLASLIRADVIAETPVCIHVRPTL